ncbi:mucolipin-3-like [Crassostrea virginica]
MPTFVLQRTVTFFKTSTTREELTVYEKFKFTNLWFVLILINDILFVAGSIFKILLEKKHAESSSENYDICALMLGCGCLFAYIGAIRYIGSFKTFNILTKVLKNAFPDMMRFLLTTILLFLGFLFCGWAVLGPYHIKFRHISTASECLFSLLNGDEMFTTFSATVTENTAVWYFSRFYLYIFTGLFIYAVLNLFVAVILDSYEKFKKNDLEPTSLQTFINECEILDPTRYQRDVRKNLGEAWSFLCESFDCLRKWYTRKSINSRFEFHNSVFDNDNSEETIH